jgi:hypothetical protein
MSYELSSALTGAAVKIIAVMSIVFIFFASLHRLQALHSPVTRSGRRGAQKSLRRNAVMPSKADYRGGFPFSPGGHQVATTKVRWPGREKWPSGHLAIMYI